MRGSCRRRALALCVIVAIVSSAVRAPGTAARTQPPASGAGTTTYGYRVNWVQLGTPYTDSRGSSPSATIAQQPAALDVVLSGACLRVLVPSYSWRQGSFDPRLWTATVTGVGSLGAGRVSRCRTDTNRRAAKCRDNVLVVNWCQSELHGASSVDVALRYGRYGAHVHVNQSRTRRATTNATSVAACTLFAEPTRLLVWAQYMLAIGTDVVYAYYNGRTADESLRSLAALVADGRLVLHDWPFDYHFYTTKRQAYGVTQTGAMLSCIVRYQHRHRWMAFLDDDEYPFVGGGRSLRELLQSKARQPSLLLESFWASVDAGASEPLSLSALATARVRKAPVADPARTKHIDARWTSGGWTVHYNQACRGRIGTRAGRLVALCAPHSQCCIRPLEGGILHFTNHTPFDGKRSTHVSAGPGHWRTRKQRAWPATNVLFDTLRSAGWRGGP